MSKPALYHNGLSSCSQKVRLVLAEKQIEFESHDVDLLSGGQHDSEYVKLNPNHVVPTLVHNGHALIESTTIGEYLEDAFPENPMRPADPAARHAMRLWTKRIDEKLHPVTAVLTYAIGPRKMILDQPEATREAVINSIPDPQRREERRSVIAHGVKAPEFANAIGVFVDHFDAMEAALEQRPWLSGDAYGLADAGTLPYVLRVDQLAMSPMIESRPRLADWLARATSRPSYESAISNWVPQIAIDLFKTQGQEVWPEVEPLTRA